MAWESFDLMKADLPQAVCVYAIYFGERLVYVGSTTDVRGRMAGHNIRYGYAKNIHTPWETIPDTTRVTLKISRSKRIGDWAMREIRLIYRLQPVFNKMHKGRKAINGR